MLVEYGDDLETIPVDGEVERLAQRRDGGRQLFLSPFAGDREHASSPRRTERLHAQCACPPGALGNRVDLRRGDRRMQCALMYPVLSDEPAERVDVASAQGGRHLPGERLDA